MKKEMKTFIRTLLCLILLLHGPFALRAQSILPRWSAPPAAEQVIVHDGFTVSYNGITKCPNWVAWELTPEEAAASAFGRTDFFTTDPAVEGPQAQYRDYTRNPYGLDRGHMAPSGDFRWSREANEQTFYLTNVCPQDHSLNDGLWLELEQRCRIYAQKHATAVHIVCGPLFGTRPRTIGEGRVWVPDAFFKAILVEIDGQAYAAAFLFENDTLDFRDDIFDYCIPLKDLRRLSGLQPFPGYRYKECTKEYPFDIEWVKPRKK